MAKNWSKQDNILTHLITWYKGCNFICIVQELYGEKTHKEYLKTTNSKALSLKLGCMLMPSGTF